MRIYKRKYRPLLCICSLNMQSVPSQAPCCNKYHMKKEELPFKQKSRGCCDIWNTAVLWLKGGGTFRKFFQQLFSKIWSLGITTQGSSDCGECRTQNKRLRKPRLVRADGLIEEFLSLLWEQDPLLRTSRDKVPDYLTAPFPILTVRILCHIFSWWNPKQPIQKGFICRYL